MKTLSLGFLVALLVVVVSAPAAAISYSSVTLSVPLSVNYLPAGTKIPVLCGLNPPPGSGMKSGAEYQTITVPPLPPGSTSYGTTVTFQFNPATYGGKSFPTGTAFTCSLGAPGQSFDMGTINGSQSTTSVGPVLLK
jgi:hypothetical protein